MQLYPLLNKCSSGTALSLALSENQRVINEKPYEKLMTQLQNVTNIPKIHSFPAKKVTLFYRQRATHVGGTLHNNNSQKFLI